MHFDRDMKILVARHLGVQEAMLSDSTGDDTLMALIFHEMAHDVVGNVQPRRITTLPVPLQMALLSSSDLLRCAVNSPDLMRDMLHITRPVTPAGDTMARYSHAFDFAFEVISEDENGDDVTPAMLRAAIIERANRLTDRELDEACGLYDTYLIEELDGDGLLLMTVH